MIDTKLIIVLILGVCFIILFEYDERLTSSIKILYYLIPLALIMIVLYDNYHQKFMCPAAKKYLRWITLLALILSICIYLFTWDNYYPHMVYRTSMHVIWAILIVFTILYLGDPNSFERMGVLKLVLFVGLLVSFLYV